MVEPEARDIGAYRVRVAQRADADGARSVMFDTFYQVLGHGYVPRWHADVIDMDAAYFDHPRHALFVATQDEEIVGTASVRGEGPKSPPHPPWLAECYPAGKTAQIFRVYVRPEHRRNGLARALVDMSCEFIASVAGYESIYLHTNASIDGAEPFWRSIAKEVHDGRVDDGYSSAVHFEIPMPA